MSFDPANVNKKSIVFFGADGSASKYDSVTGLYYDDNKLFAPNVVVPNGSGIGSVGDPDALTIDSSGNLTAAADLLVVGNLTVSGTTTTLNTETVTIEDNIILLNSTVTGAPSSDGGIEIERGSSTNVSFFWDESDNKWSFTAGEDGGSTYFVNEISFSGDSGNDTLELGATLFFEGGSGLTSAVTDNKVSFAVDATVVSDKTLITTVDEANDLLLILDATDGSLKKVAPSDVYTQMSFTLAGDSGSSTIENSDTLTVTGGTGIGTSVTSDTVTVSVDLNELATGTVSVANDSFVFIDSDDSATKQDSIADLVAAMAGTTANTSLAATSGVMTVQIDGSTITRNGSGQLVATAAANYKTVESVSANTTVSKDVTLVTTGSSAIAITLPASPSNGQIATVKKIDSGTGTVVISGDSGNSHTVDGGTHTLYYDDESVNMVFNSGVWYKI